MESRRYNFSEEFKKAVTPFIKGECPAHGLETLLKFIILSIIEIIIILLTLLAAAIELVVEWTRKNWPGLYLGITSSRRAKKKMDEDEED